jgi:hypothetical protein
MIFAAESPHILRLTMSVEPSIKTVLSSIFSFNSGGTAAPGRRPSMIVADELRSYATAREGRDEGPQGKLYLKFHLRQY